MPEEMAKGTSSFSPFNSDSKIKDSHSTEREKNTVMIKELGNYTISLPPPLLCDLGSMADDPLKKFKKLFVLSYSFHNMYNSTQLKALKNSGFVLNSTLLCVQDRIYKNRYTLLITADHTAQKYNPHAGRY